MNEADLQRIFCAWADAKWPELAPIERVEFNLEEEGPWSEVTPGAGAYIEVVLHRPKGRVTQTIWDDLAEVISEVTRLAVKRAELGAVG